MATSNTEAPAKSPDWKPMHWYFKGDWQAAVKELWPCLYIGSGLTVVEATPNDPLAGRKRLVVRVHEDADGMRRRYQFVVDGEASPELDPDILQAYALVQWPDYFRVITDGKV